MALRAGVCSPVLHYHSRFQGLIATAVFTIIFTWNEFLFALVLTLVKVVTLPVALSGYFGSQSTFWGEAAALSIVATVPIVILTLLV